MEKPYADRLRDLERQRKSPFVASLLDHGFFVYLLTKTDYPLVLDENPNFSTMGNITYSDLDLLNTEDLTLIIKHRPIHKPEILKHVYLKALKEYDVERAQWALDHGYQVHVELFILLSRRKEDIPQLKFYSELGLAPGVFDPDTGELVESRKVLIAYKDTTYPYPRYSLTRRPIIELSSANECTSDDAYLPVVRYPGLYYSGMPSVGKQCGTFYFYEPESTNLLSLGKYLVVANKIHAYLLLKRLKEPDELIQSILSSYPIKLDSFTTVVRSPKDLEKSMIFQLPSGKYIGEKSVSKTDQLDQIICKEASRQGYDTLVLQREVGETRVVSEVLDTRDGNHLCSGWEVDLKPSDKYPAIWFVDQGFVSLP